MEEEMTNLELAQEIDKKADAVYTILMSAIRMSDFNIIDFDITEEDWDESAFVISSTDESQSFGLNSVELELMYSDGYGIPFVINGNTEGRVITLEAGVNNDTLSKMSITLDKVDSDYTLSVTMSGITRTKTITAESDEPVIDDNVIG